MLAAITTIVWFAGFAFLAALALNGRSQKLAGLLMAVFWPAVLVWLAAMVFVDQIRHMVWMKRNRELIAHDFGDDLKD